LSGAELIPGPRYGEATLRWTPTLDDLGSQVVTVTVTDGGNGNSGHVLADFETFQIIVRETNSAPQVNTPDRIQAREAETLVLDIAGTDPDGDHLRYDAQSQLPPGANLNPATGQLTWTPNYQQAGDYPLVI